MAGPPFVFSVEDGLCLSPGGFQNNNCLPKLLGTVRDRIQSQNCQPHLTRHHPIPGCPEPVCPPHLDGPIQLPCYSTGELNKAEQKHELGKFSDPCDGKTDALSWGFWSITGPPWSWELPGEKGLIKASLKEEMER